MKNLHYLKKFVVMVLAAMMTLSTFALPTFAADTTMKISGVTNEAGNFDKTATVAGYKVVEQNKDGDWVMTKAFGDQDRFEETGKWFIKGTDIECKFGQAVKGADGKDKPWTPDETVLAALAKLASGDGDISFTAKEATKTFENTGSEVGCWLVLVTPGQVGSIYNPMIVSRDYKSAGDVTALTAEEAEEQGSAVAKKSNIPFEKVVERADKNAPATNTPNDNVTGDGLTGNDGKSPKDANFDGTNDGNLGDTAGSTGGKVTLNEDGTATFSHEGQTFDDVAFRIGTKFPNYAENYFKADEDGNYPVKVGNFYNPTFKINDTLSPGLTLKKDTIVVKVDGKPLTSGYTITHTNDKKDFTVTFDAAVIKANPEKLVEVCYSASLNGDHGVNFHGEKNTAELHYSNKPGEDSTVDEERETYHYTFTINGDVDAKAKKENREVIKIGLDENENWVLKETVAVEEEDWHPLKGVKFELRDGKGKDAKVVKEEIVTDKDGILRGMDQIDAGVYYLYETSLGDEEENQKYSVKDIPVKIEIKAELDAKGRLVKYQVIAGQDGGEEILVGNYEKVYEGDDKGVYFLSNDGTNKRIAKMDKDGNFNDIETSLGTVARHINEEFEIDDTDMEAANIINTPVGTLPSTGGMGTVLFTVAGAAIMALALFLLFGGKKKQHQK